MSYINIDIFREKGAKSFSKQNLGATEFYKKMNKKKL
jgi:hypothetical protein